jgi:hypothetical protein
MRNKWFRRIKWFIELFTPGGTEYTEFGMECHVSRTGAITTPEEEMGKLGDRAIELMRGVNERSRESRAERN